MISTTTALAQQSLYVYLQSENLQPFYVQMEDKVYSSSAIGHLVIAGLPDKTCNFEIGFPGQNLKTEIRVFENPNPNKTWNMIQTLQGNTYNINVNLF